MTETPCPQAWHAGLRIGVLRECRFPAKHRGWQAGSVRLDPLRAHLTSDVENTDSQTRRWH